jgi:Uma2 family endonuclease
MTTALSPPSSTLLLENIDWQTYTRLLHAFENKPSIRLTYDRGRLEIMSPRREHEIDNRMLDRLVFVLAEELGMEINSGGSTTYRRRRKKRGLEPDDSYWIANEPKVRGKRRINLNVDPPPDLAIEVDLTNSCLDRQSIYAALKVPEVWRLAGNSLAFLILGAGGNYTEGTSLSFPFLKPDDLMQFLAMYDQVSEIALVRRFREWVRQGIAEGWK